MILSRRAVSAASRTLSRRTSSIAPLTRLYATDAAGAATAESTTSNTKTTPAASKWPKAKTVKAPSATANANKKSAPMALASEVLYEPKTIAHQVQDGQAPELDATGLPMIDWANSFHGISSKPVTEQQFKVLMAPISEKDIEVKPDGVIYLPEIKYRRRLNETFGPMGWGMIPKGEPVVGSSIVTREYALIVDGRFVSQAQGENSYFSPDQLPSAVEGCKSNALMRCCKDLGIGSELWDPHFVRWFKKTQMEEVWVEHATTKKKRTFWYRKGEVDVVYPYKLAK